MARNLHKIATVNLRDLETALDLIGDMAMSVPTNHANDYLDELDLHTLVNSDIRTLILNAFEEGWKDHEQWETVLKRCETILPTAHDEGTSYCTSIPEHSHAELRTEISRRSERDHEIYKATGN